MCSLTANEIYGLSEHSLCHSFFFGIPLKRITASLFETDQQSPTNATLMTQLARAEIPPSVTTIELVFYLEVQQDVSRKMHPGTSHAA